MIDRTDSANDMTGMPTPAMLRDMAWIPRLLTRLAPSALRLFVTLAGITLLAFFVIRLAPGDPVLLMVGERGSDPAQYHQTARRLGLDAPVGLQYLRFVARAAQGDLGISVVSGRPVAAELLARWPASLELGVAALLIALATGIPAGVLAAQHRNGLFDRLVTAGVLTFYAMPIFWLGLVLILVFSVQLGIAPVAGRIDAVYDIEPATGLMLVDTLRPATVRQYGISAFADALRHLLLPALTMGMGPLAVFARVTRASMIEVLGEDYIRTARARGLSEARVIWVHALRNALLPIITVAGLFFVSASVAGAILTENLFGWAGIGSYIVSSVNARDYPVIQGATLMIGVLVIAVNAAVEMLYRAVNPRLRA